MFKSLSPMAVNRSAPFKVPSCTVLVLAAALIGGVGGIGGCASSRSSASDLVPPDPAESARQLESASFFLRQAQRLELAGNEVAAIEQYRKAIDTYRELPVAWNNLGSLLMKRGEHLAAAEAFKTASELSPTDPRPVHNLGSLWEKLGYYDDAFRWYGEALERDQNFQASLRRLLIMEEIRNKPDDRTFERIRKGLEQERDPWWVERFQRSRVRLEDQANKARTDAMSRP